MKINDASSTTLCEGQGQRERGGGERKREEGERGEIEIERGQRKRWERGI